MVRNGADTMLWAPAHYALNIEDYRAKHHTRQIARDAARDLEWSCPELQFSPDYLAGFEDGLADYLMYGGNGLPPLVPPRKYWRHGYAAPYGYQAIQDWFAGFAAGAEHGMIQAGAAIGTVPSSLATHPYFPDGQPYYMEEMPGGYNEFVPEGQFLPPPADDLNPIPNESWFEAPTELPPTEEDAWPTVPPVEVPIVQEQVWPEPPPVTVPPQTNIDWPAPPPVQFSPEGLEATESPARTIGLPNMMTVPLIPAVITDPAPDEFGVPAVHFDMPNEDGAGQIDQTGFVVPLKKAPASQSSKSKRTFRELPPTGGMTPAGRPIRLQGHRPLSQEK